MDMNNLIPWNRSRNVAGARYADEASPFLVFHREVSRLMDDFPRGFDLPATRLGWSAGWPQVDVSETDKAVRVTAEIPGLDEKDVELTLNDNVLILKGEKKAENESPTYSERWHGRFERAIPLGTDIDPDKVEASFKNGVLTVVINKRPESQRKAKRIAIANK